MLQEFKNEPILDFSLDANRKKQAEGLELVRSQLGREYDLIIGDARLKAPGKFRSINPSKKSEVIGGFQEGTPEHARQAIEAAAEAFHSWKHIQAKERADLL